VFLAPAAFVELMRTRLALLAVPLVAVAAVTAQAPQDRRQPTFRSGANYVRVDMYATRDGKPITDLKATEVEVLEDGVPQKIEDFEYVVVRPAGPDSTRTEVDGLSGSRQAAGDPRARVFVIFLDTYHTQAFGSARMRKPLVAFLDRLLGPDDLVALMTPEMAASDIALGRKTTVISKVLTEEWWGRRSRVADDDPKEVLYRQCGARMGLSAAVVEEMIARRREKMTFDALEDLLVHLGGLRDERKAVITVTEGWLLFRPNPKLAQGGEPAEIPAFRPPVPPPTERGALNQPLQVECEADRHALALLDDDTRLRRIGEDANRSNVTFYPVFARGLVVFDASIEENVSLQQDAANLRSRQESMRSLAVDTEGEAIINTNNIEGGLRRIADDLSSYYLFGYYSTNGKLDGRYRTITVRVKQPGVRVRARRGYRARTAEQVVAAATVAANVDPASTAVTNALNSVVGVNARSTFRVRPTVWMHTQGGTTGGAVWVVGELDFRSLREPAWVGGASGEVLLLSANGDQLASSPVDVPAGQGAFSVRVPTAGPLTPGDYAVRVRLRGRDASASDTARVTVPEKPSAVGEAVMWRRGGSTGPQFVRTADPRFQRSDRLRLELATDTNGATARLLDRVGKALQVPVQVTERADADGIRWIVADVTLAPLAPGDYAIEVTAGGEIQVTGFRIIP
jgi:VWFA-related protein